MACTVAACSSGTTATSQQSAPPPAQVTLGTSSPVADGHPAAAWPQYGQNAGRAGVAAGLPTAGPLSQRWAADLDGAVYGQPLVVGGTVIAATENDTVYALNESTGTVTWHTHLGSPVPLSSLPCGDIDPLGITGTPVYDESNGLVYAVAETTGYHHVMFGLAVSNGAIRVQREIPVPGDPAAFQQRPGLAIDGGRVYAAFGGLYGDCGQYIGMVVGVPLSGHGRARQLARAHQQGRRRLGHRRAGHRPVRRPVGLDRERRGRARAAVRRQRLGEQAQPGSRQDELLRPRDLGAR